MTRYIIEYLDRDGDRIDGWEYTTPAEAQAGLAEIATNRIVVHDDDEDRGPGEPEFVVGTLVWYQEEDDE